MERYYTPAPMAAQKGLRLNNLTIAGIIGAAGLVIQIIIGFMLAGSGDVTGSMLVYPHMLIGISGIALVAFLVAAIFLMPSSMIARLVYAAAFLLTFAQVALGFRILSTPDDMLTMAHQGLAIVILVLLALGGMLSARSRRKMMAAAAKPA